MKNYLKSKELKKQIRVGKGSAEIGTVVVDCS